MPRQQGVTVAQGELGPPGRLGGAFETLVMRYINNVFPAVKSWKTRGHVTADQTLLCRERQINRAIEHTSIIEIKERRIIHHKRLE